MFDLRKQRAVNWIFSTATSVTLYSELESDRTKMHRSKDIKLQEHLSLLKLSVQNIKVRLFKEDCQRLSRIKIFVFLRTFRISVYTQK